MLPVSRSQAYSVEILQKREVRTAVAACTSTLRTGCQRQQLTKGIEQLQ